LLIWGKNSIFSCKLCISVGSEVLTAVVMKHTIFWGEPGWHSRYSDCLRAGWPRSRSSSPGRAEHFLFSTSSRPVLGPTQPPIQWILGASFPWG
jgi:hypothetical protein